MAGIWDFLKGTTPGNRGANYAGVFHTSAGPGYNTPIALAAIDESGNVANLAHFAVLDYRLLKVTLLASASGTWTPANGCRAIYVEVLAGGGQGGGGPTGTGSAMGGGGGAGGYSASWITGISTTKPYTCGAGGSTTVAGNSTGQAGADSTWDTSVIVAKGGGGGLGCAISTTIILGGLGGAGGVAASGTGDLKADGSAGGTGLVLSTAGAGISGYGAAGFFGGGAISKITHGNGNNGGQYGSGGSGGATVNSAGATKGGNGGNGCIRVWEFS